MLEGRILFHNCCFYWTSSTLGSMESNQNSRENLYLQLEILCQYSRASVSVMKFFSWQRNSVSAIGITCPLNKYLPVVILDATVLACN